MAWHAGALAANPGANQVLADTAALPAGLYTVHIAVHAFDNAAMASPVIALEHRDAANGATLRSKAIPVMGGTLGQIPPFIIRLAQNERLRIIARSAITNGEAEASIFIARTAVVNGQPAS